MYFVTIKHPGYVLFCTTPSERFAVGLADAQVVRVLARDAPGTPWQTVAEWDTADFSHTDFMAAWHRQPEPAGARDLLAVLPDTVRVRRS